MRTSEEGCGGGGGGGRRVLLFCLSPSGLATFLPNYMYVARPDRSWLLPSVSHRLLCRRDVPSSGRFLLYPRPSQSASTGVCQSGRGEREKRGAGAFHHPCRSPGGGLRWPPWLPQLPPGLPFNYFLHPHGRTSASRCISPARPGNIPIVPCSVRLFALKHVYDLLYLLHMGNGRGAKNSRPRIANCNSDLLTD